MKQKLLLKAMLLLCALVAGSSSVWADVSTLTPTSSKIAPSDDHFNVTYATGGGTAAAWGSNSCLRLYAKNTITIASISAEKITQITFTGTVNANSKGKFPDTMSADVGTITPSTISSTGVTDFSWTYATGTTSVTITLGGTAGNIDLTGGSFVVTYTPSTTPKHTATFSVNGATNSTEYLEGAAITFPANPSDIGGKKFMGWATAAIVGTTDVAPTFYTSATMSTSDITYYAVFASQTDVEGYPTLTITPSTTNFPTSYGTAKTFTEYTLEGKKFKIQQAYINSGKLQWRSGTDASNGAGTIYNTDALKNIQSIVLTYNGDSNKNFTLKIGDAANPSSGTAITPSVSATDENEYTYDCSTYNKDFFVLTNGDKAGYLASIAITYEGYVTSYSGYCTTVAVPSSVSVTIASSGYSTIASGWGLDFSSATPAGLEAYVASELSASAITLTSIDEAPASTGIVLKGEPGTEYTIPVKDGVAAVGTNKLQAAVYPTGVDANSAYILKGGKFCLVTNASLVPAGKAYLLKNDIPAAASAPGYLGFDFESTNISTTNFTNDTNNSGVFYNLAGQRVANPTKGLYIVNGKKVVLK